MKIEVYILTYNRSVFLKESIQSVLSQTYTDFKLIVLDNHSTDDTPSVVSKFDDNRITYIRHEKNLGGYGNYMYAFNHCKSDYVVIFHDDDIMLPNFLEDEVSIMEKNYQVDAVAGNSIFFNDGNDNEYLFNNGSNNEYHGTDVLRTFLSDRKTFVFPSIMYRVEFLKNKKILLDKNVGPCGDVVFYSDITLAGGTIYELNVPVMRSRIHCNQDSNINFFSMHIQLFSYLCNSSRYRNAYLSLSKERKKAYRRFSMASLGHIVRLHLPKDEAKYNLNKLGELLMVKNVFNIWIVLIDVYYCNPRLFGMLVYKLLEIKRKIERKSIGQ